MLKNRSQIIRAIKTVANVIGDLNEKIVFVGGAVAVLYIDDPGAPEIRPTEGDGDEFLTSSIIYFLIPL